MLEGAGSEAQEGVGGLVDYVEDFRPPAVPVENAVSRSDAERRQRMPDAVHVLGQCGVGEISSLECDGDAIAIPLPDVPVDQVVRQVVHDGDSTADRAQSAPMSAWPYRLQVIETPAELDVSIVVTASGSDFR